MTDLSAAHAPSRPARTTRWTPRHVQVTAAAAEQPRTTEILRRLEAAGVKDIRMLKANRLAGLSEGNEREIYARAKNTLAVVVAPPSTLTPQPIPPSADWRIDLARGCPAHCQYCYLAGSLNGPPVTRVYADLDDILDNLTEYAHRGTVTSRSTGRAHEGTTFEASCYTDPLALDHLTGSWERAVRHFGTWDDDVQLRWTTKYDDVERFVGLPHAGRTRVRLSVNALPITTRFEGGTSPLAARLGALRRLALDGYPVGLTIAPIMPLPDWREHYDELLRQVAEAVDGVHGLDLTAELITHRFTPGSKDVLTGWYPRTRLEMDEASRSRKHGKFGNVKYVYPADVMRELKAWFTARIAETLPGCRVLYWT